MGLEELRSEIDEVDQQIVDLLNRRARLSQQVGSAKRQQAGEGQEPEIYLPHREAQVYAHVDAVNQGPLPRDAVQAIYHEILSSSRALQRTLRVGYLGPVASFAYEAATVHFGRSTNLVPCRTIADVFVEAQRHAVDYGVVPSENSTGGAVTHTLDQFLETDLQICAQIELPIIQNLLGRGTIDSITRVYSHPQALLQCRRWLAENLPHATQIETASTSLAAQMVEDEQTAAIATESAATVYGLKILVPAIQDAATNVTRFFVIGPQRSARSGRDRTAIVFTVHDRIGALQSALQVLANNQINLTHIESRPSQRRLWDYVFFADLDGHPDDDGVARALNQLDDVCASVRVLGAWPA